MNSNNNDNLKKYKIPLIIIGSILFLMAIIFIFIKLINKNNLVYEDEKI